MIEIKKLEFVLNEPYKIIFTDKLEAEKLLSSAKKIIHQYGKVFIDDICDLIGVDFDLFYGKEALKYGWDDLENSEIIKENDYYYINFPRVKNLENGR